MPAPGATVPSEQGKLEQPLEALTKVRPAGVGLATLAPSAELGPLLLTVIV